MKATYILAAVAVFAALAAGDASARTNGTCTFKSNWAAVGVRLSGTDVGAGYCQILRRGLGSGFHSGRASFAHPYVACLFQYGSLDMYVGIVGERYGKIAPAFCRMIAPKLAGWTRIR